MFLLIKKELKGEYVPLLIDMQKLIINIRKFLIKIRNRHIYNIGT